MTLLNGKLDLMNKGEGRRGGEKGEGKREGEGRREEGEGDEKEKEKEDEYEKEKGGKEGTAGVACEGI